MRTFKRTNWTTEEVIELIKGQKIVRADGVGGENEYCKLYNEVIDDVVDYFYDFIRPLNEFGALGMCTEDGVIYHIGGIPEEEVERWKAEKLEEN